MNFDLDQIQATRQNTYRLVLGTNLEFKDEEVGFTVVGPNSVEYQKATHDAAVAGVQAAHLRLEAEKVDEKLAKARNTPGSREHAEMFIERTDQSNDLVVDACVVGWFGFRRGPELVEFNRKDLKDLLDARPGWRARVLRVIEDSENFNAG